MNKKIRVFRASTKCYIVFILWFLCFWSWCECNCGVYAVGVGDLDKERSKVWTTQHKKRMKQNPKQQQKQTENKI